MALFAVLFATVWSVARVANAGSTVGPFGWREVWGLVAVISFFFRLRVFDEQKDYAIDAINHPQRVLQTGRVTLPQLGRLALLGGVVELGWCVLMGVPVCLTWLLAVGYSGLMRYEFFASRYLGQRLVLYAFTHMLIMPLVIGWIWSAYVPRLALSAPLLLLAALSVLGGFAFEIARKLHSPDAERDRVDSYSKTLGYGGAIGAVLGVLLLSGVVQACLLHLLRAGALPYWLLGLLFLATLTLYAYALTHPRESLLKLAGLLVSLAMVISYVSIILVVNLNV